MSVRLMIAALAPTLILMTGFGTVPETRKLILIAGKQSHGPGDHEFRAGSLLLQKCLKKIPGLEVLVVSNGWPEDAKVFDGAAAVVCYADGGGGHPFLQSDHLKIIGDLVKKGVGIGAMHYGVEVPKEKGGPDLTEWIGGYYEAQYSCNPMWSPDYEKFPDHPIARGVKPFSTEDEWYMNIRFRPEMKGITPLLVAKPSDQVRKGPYVYPKGPYDHIVAASGRDETMMWCVDRPDGGRGFGFTGGHRHRNWSNDNQRKIVLNALVWLCKLDVPSGGVESTVTPEELQQNLDPKKK
jgi:type 1 glutamine amidotransferase